MVPGCCSATGNTAGLQMPECFVQVLAHAPGKSVGVGFGHRRVVGRKRAATAGRWLPSLRTVGSRFMAGAPKWCGFGRGPEQSLPCSHFHRSVMPNNSFKPTPFHGAA